MLVGCRGMSGMRIGCLHTKNEALLGALDTLSYFALPSTLMQEAATQLLTDEPFVDEYIAENMRRLGRSYDALTGALAWSTHDHSQTQQSHTLGLHATA